MKLEAAIKATIAPTSEAASTKGPWVALGST
jgi:hypothetical protein